MDSLLTEEQYEKKKARIIGEAIGLICTWLLAKNSGLELKTNVLIQKFSSRELAGPLSSRLAEAIDKEVTKLDQEAHNEVSGSGSRKGFIPTAWQKTK